MSFDKLTPNQRIQAANIDCMRHPQFSRLAGVIAMGKSETSPAIPTACTNGKDKLYGAEFIGDMTRKQLRYLVLHENFHVALKHCVLPYYVDLFKKHGQLSNMAADYVVNGMISTGSVRMVSHEENGTRIEQVRSESRLLSKVRGLSLPGASPISRRVLPPASGGGDAEPGAAVGP